MQHRLIVLTLSLFIWMPATANEISAEKQAAIRSLMELTGAAELGEMFSQAFTRQMVQSLQQSQPDADPRMFSIVESEINAVIHEELVENETLQAILYPIYDRHFTLEEIQALSTFYSTPLGRKTVAIMPKITQESLQAGQRWGQGIGPKIAQRVQAKLEQEGY